jgi:short-subunit dehydrogenase
MAFKNRYVGYALITGASSGIGRSFAFKLAERGIDLVLVARRLEKLRDIRNKIVSEFNIDVRLIKCDLSENNFLELIKKETDLLEIGILINNAGMGSTGYFINNDEDNEADLIKLNCLVPIALTRHFLKGMKERKSGAVIFVGSVLGFNPTPLSAVYSASKSFLNHFGNTLFYELKDLGIDVLTINPGSTKTEFERLTSNDEGFIVRMPEQVVDTALKALGRKISVTDAWFNKLLHIPRRFFTQKFAVKLAGKISKKKLAGKR